MHLHPPSHTMYRLTICQYQEFIINNTCQYHTYCKQHACTLYKIPKSDMCAKGTVCVCKGS